MQSNTCSVRPSENALVVGRLRKQTPPVATPSSTATAPPRLCPPDPPLPQASPVRDPRGSSFTDAATAARAGGPGASRLGDEPPPPGAATAALAFAAAPTSLPGDLLPVDAAVPLGRLERGAEHGATVRLTAARAGLARLSSLCLRDALTGSVYVPACPYEVFVES